MTILVWTGVAVWMGFAAVVTFGPTLAPMQAAVRRHRKIGRNRRA